MLAVTGSAEFGRYRLEQLLGRGGMGEVYRARDTALDRDVAIKLLPPGAIADAPARARLLREAKAAAALDHPGICTVYEAGETPDGRAFIAMQLVEGESLAERVRRGPLPVREALDLCAQIAEALGAAHKHGIVHRDLKPGNVIVGPSGRPVLLDFGIAKVITARLASDSTTVSDATTGSALIGTPSYMSPEQVQQRPVDGRTDLFALGVLFYECLTGHRPFDAPSAVETIANVLHVQPSPPSTLRHELTDRHDLLCARLLAKEPADRFQSADEVIGAVRVLTVDTGRVTGTQPAPLPQPSWWTGLPRLAWMVLAVAVVGITAVWWWTRPAALPVAPRAAQYWYDKGVTNIREGAYLSARNALEQAVAVFPQYALAFARLADADAELDDIGAAKDHLLRVSEVVPDQSRLPPLEQLRLQATRALAVRDLDQAVAAHERIVSQTPQDAGAWLDLGRAQEAAGTLSKGRASYRRATELDTQYAAAFLRLAYVAGQERRRPEALAAYATAERLFGAASNEEGLVEVLLRRGGLYDGLGDYKPARADLERARTLARSPSQRIRAQLALGSVTASEGRLSEAARITSEAIAAAREADLRTLEADGLIDLSATHADQGQRDEARADARRAIELASQRGARRTLNRAKLQLAACLEQEDRPRDALAVLDEVLPFFRQNQYRQFELTALAIAARNQRQIEAYDKAQELATQMLQLAGALDDQARVALAESELGTTLTERGNYPEALTHRTRAAEIFRARGDQSYLPSVLAARADLLIRLGRAPEANAPLSEVEAGIAARVETYSRLARRARYLRGFAALVSSRWDAAIRELTPLEDAEALDPAAIVGPGMRAYCQARMGQRLTRVLPLPPGAPAARAVERAYWLGLAALVRSDRAALAAAAADARGRLSTTTHDELRWRVEALAALAAAAAAPQPLGTTGTSAAADPLGRLRHSWGSAFTSYVARPDVDDVLKRTGLR